MKGTGVCVRRLFRFADGGILIMSMASTESTASAVRQRRTLLLVDADWVSGHIEDENLVVLGAGIIRTATTP